MEKNKELRVFAEEIRVETLKELANLGQELPDRRYTVSDLKDFTAKAAEEILEMVKLAEG